MTLAVLLYAATLESLEVPIKTSSDPTATVPRFALSASGASSPGTYANGAWADSFNTATQYTTARTPTIGGSGSLQIASGSRYDVWVEVTLGSEVAEWKVGTIVCP